MDARVHKAAASLRHFKSLIPRRADADKPAANTPEAYAAYTPHKLLRGRWISRLTSPRNEILSDYDRQLKKRLNVSDLPLGRQTTKDYEALAKAAMDDKIGRIRKLKAAQPKPPFGVPLPDYSDKALDKHIPVYTNPLPPALSAARGWGGTWFQDANALALPLESSQGEGAHTDIRAHEATHALQLPAKTRWQKVKQAFKGRVQDKTVRKPVLGVRSSNEDLSAGKPGAVLGYLSEPLEMDARAAEWGRYAENRLIDPTTGKLFRIDSPETARRAMKKMQKNNGEAMPRWEDWTVYRMHPELMEFILQRMPLLGNNQPVENSRISRTAASLDDFRSLIPGRTSAMVPSSMMPSKPKPKPKPVTESPNISAVRTTSGPKDAAGQPAAPKPLTTRAVPAAKATAPTPVTSTQPSAKPKTPRPIVESPNFGNYSELESMYKALTGG